MTQHFTPSDSANFIPFDQARTTIQSPRISAPPDTASLGALPLAGDATASPSGTGMRRNAAEESHPQWPNADMTESSAGHFGWEPCGLAISSKSGVHIVQCVADTENLYQLRVSLARPLSWDSKKRQFRWHKTWRVPDISVLANPAALGGTGGIEARLAVVCTSNTSAGKLEDAGVTSTATGPSGQDAVVSMVDGEARFSRLRLIGTTATFGGRAFHFVVSLIRAGHDKQAEPEVLASVISTAFAVYSRKNADKPKPPVDRKRLESGRWSEGYSFIPFDPSELDRTFVKKVTGPNGHTIEQVIDNSWEGLLNYFAAPNIRHKVRHPLFLAIRFSNVLVIMRDSLRFPDEDEQALRSFVCSCGFPLGCQRDPAVDIGHGEFLPPNLIALRRSAFPSCPPEVKQKLIQLLSVVKGPALGFVPDNSLLPARYTPVIGVDKLVPLYRRLYANEFATVRDEDMSDGSHRSKRARTDTDSAARGDQDTASTRTHGSSPQGSMVSHRPAPSTSQPRATTQPQPYSAQHLPEDPPVPVAAPPPVHESADESSKAAFKSYFMSLHAELRMLLGKVVELATEAASGSQWDTIDRLRRAYSDFTEALHVHAHIEENILFSKLNEKVPQVADSYCLDHEKDESRLETIRGLLADGQNMGTASPETYAKLFMQISNLATLHTVHMQKEEEHLLPLFLQTMSNQEIFQMIDQSQRQIDLENARHQSSINRARAAAGLVPLDHVADPPVEVNSPSWFFDEDVLSNLDAVANDMLYKSEPDNIVMP